MILFTNNNNRLYQTTLLCCLALLVFMQPLRLMADNAPGEEYKLKAALLYKLTQFVEWPSLKTNPENALFGLCVLGENDFASSLDALKLRKIGDRTISVNYYRQSSDVIGNCDLVFISKSKRPFLKSILRKLKNHPVLSVSDIKNFAQRGGIIQFTTGKQIGFKINIESAKNSRLKIAAPLLQLAEIIGPMDK